MKKHFFALPFLFFILLGGSCKKTNPPKAYFTVEKDSYCPPPCEIKFHDLSEGATSLRWSFGDGNSKANESHTMNTYNSPGTYPVVLTATNEDGEDQFSQDVTVDALTPPAGADFNIIGAPCEIGCEIFFENASSDYTTSEWDFGDGSAADFSNSTSHVFNSNGTFPVKLTVKNSAGQPATKTKNVTISEGSGSPKVYIKRVVVNSLEDLYGFDNYIDGPDVYERMFYYEDFSEEWLLFSYCDTLYNVTEDIFPLFWAWDTPRELDINESYYFAFFDYDNPSYSDFLGSSLTFSPSQYSITKPTTIDITDWSSGIEIEIELLWD